MLSFLIILLFRDTFVKTDVVKNGDFITQFLKSTNFDDNEDIKAMPDDFFKLRGKA